MSRCSGSDEAPEIQGWADRGPFVPPTEATFASAIPPVLRARFFVMCGRATLATPVEEIVEQLGVALGDPPIDIGPPRFNVAPGQPIVVVRAPREPREKPELGLVKWGLVPRWAKAEDTKRLGSRGIQARAETVARAPAFRDAWDGRRCLVVVDGFYEWKTLPDGRRVPHHLRMKDGRLMTLGGVWDRWHRKGTPALETGAVITTHAQGPIRALHDRMPLIVPASERDAWLSGSVDDAHAILEHASKAQATAALELDVTPVSTWVNDVRHEDARCIEPAPIGPSASETTSSSEGPPLGQVSLDFRPSRSARSSRSRR